MLAADFFENSTIHSGFRAPIEPQRPASPPPLETKVYLTFTFAEGDNVQYDQHRLRQIWDDPNRGTVPLNWSVSPLLVDLAPLIISHYLSTATPNDLSSPGLRARATSSRRSGRRTTCRRSWNRTSRTSTGSG